MATIVARCRNNADARRIGAHQIGIPGADSVKHTGGHMIKIETEAVDTTKHWLDSAFEIDSYEVQS